MKKNINKIKFCIIAIGLIGLQSCSNESFSSEIQSKVKSGAILRTIAINSSTFSFGDPASNWSITVEEQDITIGKNFAEVKIYASHTTEGATSSEQFIKTVSSTTFTTDESENGYPRGEISVTLGEILTKLNLSSSDYTNTDKFNIRLEVVLKDGRSFSALDSSSTVTGGSYFSSPFEFSAQFSCPLTDASLFNGTYEITSDAWADYSEGDTETVVYNPANGLLTFRILNLNRPYISLATSTNTYLICTINPDTAEVTVTSNDVWDYGGGYTPTVTGTGSVGSCTGDINLKLNFDGSSDYEFNLVKN